MKSRVAVAVLLATVLATLMAPPVHATTSLRAPVAPAPAGIWHISDISSPTYGPVNMSHLSCGGEGFCVGTAVLGARDFTAPALPVTRDFGATWSFPTLPADVVRVDVVSCGSDRHCVASAVGGPNGCGCRAEFLVTDDAGASWSEVVPASCCVYAVAWLSCPDAVHCIAGGFEQGALPAPIVVLSSGDGGRHWSRSSAVLMDQAAVSCRTASSCLLATGGHDESGSGSADRPLRLLRTSDGGANWTDTGAQLTGMLVAAPPACPTALHCVIVGTDSSDTVSPPPPGGAGAAWVTSDGGSTWTRASLPADVASLSSVSCADASRCWATGALGTADPEPLVVLSSADGGRTWASSLGGEAGGSVWCDPLGLCLVVGDSKEARLTGPVVAVAATPDARGYYLATSDGTVYPFGDATFSGDLADRPIAAPIEAMAVDPSTGGYWLLGRDGGVFSFHAPFFGSTATMRLTAAVVGIAPVPSGRGYRLAAADGGVFDFGPEAHFVGSMGGRHLDADVVGIATDPHTGGFWLVAADGGVFAFRAPFFGSAGSLRLVAPVVAAATVPSGAGYRLVASDGGVFDYGPTRFGGSLAGAVLASAVVGVADMSAGTGYWLVEAGGVVTAFGKAPNYGGV
jgi:photosystem II stability/assembly factor-like uncharacterized protein